MSGQRSGQGDRFGAFAVAVSRLSGKPGTFLLAALLVIAWLVTGPLFDYSDTWQLVINTATTIITFLMVFLIQSTQNRDTEAMQLKLDELIRASKGAHNAMLDLEALSDEDRAKVRQRYQELADQARRDIAAGRGDTGVPDTGSVGPVAARPKG